jgi:NAD(P)-dependent dehydrogenase (short-subunit alcohol dehydrogenase family)
MSRVAVVTGGTRGIGEANRHRNGQGGAAGRAGQEHSAAHSARPTGRTGGDRAWPGFGDLALAECGSSP